MRKAGKEEKGKRGKEETAERRNGVVGGGEASKISGGLVPVFQLSTLVRSVVGGLAQQKTRQLE